MKLPSDLMEKTVQELGKLPGIGKKTALRLALHLVQSDLSVAEALGGSIQQMRREIKFCKVCNNISDDDTCSICNNQRRDKSIICVVESIRELLIIENTGHYNGVYHVLGGLISPIDNINPDDLKIEQLIKRVETGNVSELIMALSPTMEGDTTVFYISRKLDAHPVKITSIARGVAFGTEIEYTDDVTLARSIASRQPFDAYMNGKQ